MDFCAHWGHYKTNIFFTCTTFQNFIRMVQSMGGIKQLQPSGQQHTQLKTYDQLIQTSPPYDEYIMEIRQQWISTPFEDQTTVFQDLQQDFQVSNVEL